MILNKTPPQTVPDGTPPSQSTSQLKNCHSGDRRFANFPLCPFMGSTHVKL